MHLKMSRLVTEQQCLSLYHIDCTNHSKCCRSRRSAQFRCFFELATDNLDLGWRQLQINFSLDQITSVVNEPEQTIVAALFSVYVSSFVIVTPVGFHCTLTVSVVSVPTTSPACFTVQVNLRRWCDRSTLAIFSSEVTVVNRLSSEGLKRRLKTIQLRRINHTEPCSRPNNPRPGHPSTPNLAVVWRLTPYIWQRWYQICLLQCRLSSFPVRRWVLLKWRWSETCFSYVSTLSNSIKILRDNHESWLMTHCQNNTILDEFIPVTLMSIGVTLPLSLSQLYEPASSSVTSVNVNTSFAWPLVLSALFHVFLIKCNFTANFKPQI